MVEQWQGKQLGEQLVEDGTVKTQMQQDSPKNLEKLPPLHYLRVCWMEKRKEQW